jgi:hypothetical protein
MAQTCARDAIGDMCVCVPDCFVSRRQCILLSFLFSSVPRDGRNRVVQFRLLVLSALQFSSSGSGCCYLLPTHTHTHTARSVRDRVLLTFCHAILFVHGKESILISSVCPSARWKQHKRPPLSVRPSARLQK